MKIVKAFQCSHCTFYRKTKAPVVNHENTCFRNPENKACASCKYNVKDFETVYNRNHGGDPGRTDYEVSYNWCTKKEIDLNNKTLTTNCPLWQNDEAPQDLKQ